MCLWTEDEDSHMFTGIVEAQCQIASIRSTADGARLVVDLGSLEELPCVSDSVCIQGVCLTATHLEGSRVSFDVVRETLSRTTLGDLRPGSKVNVELSLRVGDRMGGHFVLGHVDAVATLIEAVRQKDSLMITVRSPEPLRPLIAEKGSVTLDGVSLTVARLKPGAFQVALVPYTAEVTTLGALRPGSKINLEVDVLARYVGARFGPD